MGSAMKEPSARRGENPHRIFRVILAASGDDSMSEQQKLCGRQAQRMMTCARARDSSVVVDVTKSHSGNGLPTMPSCRESMMTAARPAPLLSMGRTQFCRGFLNCCHTEALIARGSSLQQGNNNTASCKSATKASRSPTVIL